MGILSTTKKVSGHFFNFKVDRWVDFDYIKNLSSYFIFHIKYIFRLEDPNPPENFIDAAIRLEISPEELILRSKQYLFTTYLFLATSLALFIYSIYLFKNESYMGTCMTACVTFYSLSLAFRYHFLNYQLRRLKLGCGIKEWCRDLLNPSFKSTLQIEHFKELDLSLIDYSEITIDENNETTLGENKEITLSEDSKDNEVSLSENKEIIKP